MKRVRTLLAQEIVAYGWMSSVVALGAGIYSYVYVSTVDAVAGGTFTAYGLIHLVIGRRSTKLASMRDWAMLSIVALAAGGVVYRLVS
ncbi:MAG: hypothetical protein MAG453_01358 [Calditrichaeota bacterium]|nr:hypothetical protein [Calditrichota bacterium]